MKRIHSPIVDCNGKRPRYPTDSDVFAALADSLATRPDLLRTDPLPRDNPVMFDPWASLRAPEPSRPALHRISREEAALRPRHTAIEVPRAHRRRGENRSASRTNRRRNEVPQEGGAFGAVLASVSTLSVALPVANPIAAAATASIAAMFGANLAMTQDDA